MEDLNEPGIGFAVTTSESSPDSINTKRFGMASPPASPVLAGEPPSPQSTLAAFRFGGSAQSSRPASPKSITPPAAAVSDDSEDIVPGVIQFRSPLSRQQSRVLYDGSAQASPALRTYMPGSAYFDSRRKSSASSGMSWAHTPASEDRRPSLVKPEDYLPGLPAAANAGKAMAAGFEPARTAAPVGQRKHGVGLMLTWLALATFGDTSPASLFVHSEASESPEGYAEQARRNNR